MNLTYLVPRDEYIELLADMIRRNERRPLRIAITLLMTVGQMTAVILLCIFRLQAEQRLFFFIWSVLLAALTILRRSTVKLRAKGTLQRLEYTGQLSEDFWKEHRLSVAGQELRLKYGAQQLACSLINITRMEEKPHALYLYCGETIFDFVPESAFHNREAMLKFPETLRKLAAHIKAPAEGAEPQGADDLVWKMEEKFFKNGQYLAYRTLFYRYRFLRPALFVRLAISVFAVISLINGVSGINLALCIVLLVAANLQNISMIPFICRLRIGKELGNWRGGGEYRLSLREGSIHYGSDRAAVDIPIEKINLCEKIGPYFVIAWNQFPAVVVPLEVWNTPAGNAINREMKVLYQGK